MNNEEKIDKIFEYIKEGNLDGLKFILDKNMKNKSLVKHYPEMFMEAALSKNVEMVKYLYSKNIVNYHHQSNILGVCVKNKDIEMVRLLISIYNLDKKNTEDMKKIENLMTSHDESLTIRVSPLLHAITNKDKKMMDVLMPISYPKGFKSAALYEAVIAGNNIAIDMLFDLSDPMVVREELKFLRDMDDENMATKSYVYLIGKIKSSEAKKSKSHLKKEISSPNNKSKRIKII